MVTTDIAGTTDFSDASIELTISGPSGDVMNKSTLKLNSNKKKTFDPIEVEKPQLWSPGSPDLYTCNIVLKTNTGIHKKNIRFGFRHFEFKKNGPFHLNGERLLLRGTHRHEDHAGVGPAMTEEMIRREMLMMKEMGVNFIRLAHYQQSRIVLDLCDSLGIIVWEEIPWCRGGLGGEIYKQQARRMLKNMITQHRNHPSVIIWGLGNENDWPNDFPEFDKQAIRSFMKELNEQAHKLDPTRVTVIRRCGFCKDIVDVYSPSIWAGWYRGRYTDYKRVTKHEHEQVDHFLHVEWGVDNHARRHTEDPLKNLDIVESQQRADERAGDASLYGGKARASKDGEWTETYICDLIDWHLKEQETMPWLSGTAYWPFKDFSTPIRPENPVPYVNQKGVVERDLTPNEGFYVFQSYWTDKPMIHIYGHTWPVRWGNKKEEKLVRVYSNCDEAELFVNGKSMGTKQRDSQDFPAAGLHWNVVLKEGKNTFKAIGYKGNTQVSDSITQEYQTGKWGQPSAIDVKVVEANKGFVWVEARLKDVNNVLCLDSRNYINFDLTGDGKLIDNLGTSTGSRKVQAYNGRAKIKVEMNGGKSVVSVKSANCKKGSIN